MKKILLISLSLFALNQKINAQSYDGEGDLKIFLGYTNIEGKSGGEFEIDKGVSDLISFGSKITILINPDERKTTDSIDNNFKAFDAFDLSLFMRLHFSETLKLNEKIDPFLSLNLGLKSIGANVGVKYSFTEVIGAYIIYNKSFSSSFEGDHKINSEEFDVFEDNVNFFGKKSSISCGITINIF